ncbi:BatA domain-containing protein [Maribacter sp. 2-571]|uniref:BatA domain-containing protein n=1 Tax=Maribacter sp. 2-571 TaxID=3417569 RepID=UPI003D33AA53
MQFQYPGLLWGLLLLLVPIIVHLFQLQRFRKIPFTNVKFLKKVVSESRRSRTLKKWLLLLTRLALLAALVIAFAKPFYAEKRALKPKDTVIYLDDSFSMQAKKEGNTLMREAVQSLIAAVPKELRFTLFTNSTVYRNVTISDIQNRLLEETFSSKQLNFTEVYARANNFFSDQEVSDKEFIVISDFQNRFASMNVDSLSAIRLHLVQMVPDDVKNISIDSTYIVNNANESAELVTLLSANNATENVPISLFNGDTLIAKTAAAFTDDRKAKVVFTLPTDNAIQGKLEVSDSGLSYDNRLYFNVDETPKIKVLSIGASTSKFLNRIYTRDEFTLTSVPLSGLNYGAISSQNLLILNELSTIPTALLTNLSSFVEEGGHFLLIPADDIDRPSYNELLANYFSTAILEKISSDKLVTNIAFTHPLYKNVFEKKVVNFSHPTVGSSYEMKTTAPRLLSFQDNSPFLVGDGGKYVFSGAINEENSNFIGSPLIVPTLYNIGMFSLRSPAIYHLMEQNVSVDIQAKLVKDNIVKLQKTTRELIPQQRAQANKVSLYFDETLPEDGIYAITDNIKTLGQLSFNHSRKESTLNYLDLRDVRADSKNTEVATLFENMEKDNRITELWKWFVIFAMVFLLLEVLIQKFIKS